MPLVTFTSSEDQVPPTLPPTPEKLPSVSVDHWLQLVGWDSLMVCGLNQSGSQKECYHECKYMVKVMDLQMHVWTKGGSSWV